MSDEDAVYKVMCNALDYPRSTYYHSAPPPSEAAVRDVIRAVVGQWPRYGYRRVTAELRLRGWTVNRKRVQRLMRLMNLQRKTKAKKRCTTNSEHAFPRYPNLVQDLAITRPDQVWVRDITYIVLRSECVYLAVIMDVYTRCIRWWHLGRTLEHTLTLGALQTALQTHQPEIHHSDQGVQYAATAYTAELLARGIQISMADVGEPTQNGYAERLMRTIKEEEVDLRRSAHAVSAKRRRARRGACQFVAEFRHHPLGSIFSLTGFACTHCDHRWIECAMDKHW